MGAFTWSCSGDNRGWISRTANEQARILLQELDDSDEYFADCAAHDENEYRPDRAIWYREETFDRVLLRLKSGCITA